MESQKDDLLKCALCFLQFVNPQLLPCGHVVCKKCLQSRVKHDAYTCHRCHTIANEADIKPDHRLKLFIDVLTEQADTLTGDKKPANWLQTDPDTNHCEKCWTKPISFWCRVCCLWLCVDCKDIHKNAAAWGSHTLVSIKSIDMPSLMGIERQSKRFEEEISSMHQQIKDERDRSLETHQDIGTSLHGLQPSLFTPTTQHQKVLEEISQIKLNVKDSTDANPKLYKAVATKVDSLQPLLGSTDKVCKKLQQDVSELQQKLDTDAKATKKTRQDLLAKLEHIAAPLKQIQHDIQTVTSNVSTLMQVTDDVSALQQQVTEEYHWTTTRQQSAAIGVQAVDDKLEAIGDQLKQNGVGLEAVNKRLSSHKPTFMGCMMMVTLFCVLLLVFKEICPQQFGYHLLALQELFAVGTQRMMSCVYTLYSKFQVPFN